MFPSIDYLEWIAGRPEAATHDLGSSDLRPVTGGTVVPNALTDLSAPDDATVESLVADAYDVAESNVLITPGATTANLLAVATSLGTDRDHVLVEKPGYEPHTATPRALGATVDRFVRPREAWALDPERVANATTPETALAVVSNRHNPSGVQTDRDTLQATARGVGEAGARLLVDEVYAPYGPATDGPFGGVTGAGLPNTVVTGSLTKFHGLGGLRIGWLIADEAFIEEAAQASAHLSAVSMPSRALATRALANADTLTARSRALLASNHDLLHSFLEERDDLIGTVADGCSYGLLAHESADGDTVSEVAWDAGVLVVPGRFFGVPDAVRVSLGRDPAAMADALAAFGAVLDDL